MSEYLKPAAFTILPHLGGIAGAALTRRHKMEWYDKLKKPAFTPPKWVFGPVWTGLFTSMGYASYLVYRDGGGCEGEAKTALTLYGAQLALNWAWTPLFFGAHRVGLAAVCLWGVYGVAGAATYFFFPINRTAGYLMLPYMAWLTLANAINNWIYFKNRDNTPAAVKNE